MSFGIDFLHSRDFNDIRWKWLISPVFNIPIVNIPYPYAFPIVTDQNSLLHVRCDTVSTCEFVCAHLEAFSSRAAHQDEVIPVCVCGSTGPQLLTGLILVPPAERHVLDNAETDVSAEPTTTSAHLHTHHLDTEKSENG